jgi:hypothetical protein
MTPHDVSLLLCALGCTYLATAWIGHRTGDARRDVHLALGTGVFLLTCGGWILSRNREHRLPLPQSPR